MNENISRNCNMVFVVDFCLKFLSTYEKIGMTKKMVSVQDDESVGDDERRR